MGIRIQKKICRHKMFIMFYEICINEEMLPKYTYIYICTHTHTHTHIYIYIYIYTIFTFLLLSESTVPCLWGLEYTDSIFCRRIRAPPKGCILIITLNCIRWWGSSSGDLGSVDYPLHCHYLEVHWNPGW